MLLLFKARPSRWPDRVLHLLQLLVGLIPEHVRFFVLIVEGVAWSFIHLDQLHSSYRIRFLEPRYIPS